MVDLVTSAPKAPGSYDRVVSLQFLDEFVAELRARFGITRVSDITRLDRVGIPVTTAIVPKSRDGLGVYNGKGVTQGHARMSAIMEAVERQVAASFDPPAKTVPVSSIARSLDIQALGVLRSAPERLECVDGFDLMSKSSVPVPLALLRSPWDGAVTFPFSHTSGLATGATVVEAVYHALCELVERHAYAIAASSAARMPEVFRAEEIVFPTQCPVVDGLARQIRECDLHLRLFFLPAGPMPAAFFASIQADGDPIELSTGLGCSLSPEHAAVRAITEAAQSRLVDIQGAREDVLKHSPAPRGKWYTDLPANRARFADLADRASDDVSCDVRTLVAACEQAGVKRVVAVRLSGPEFPVSVVRVIAPELSNYIIDGRPGALITRGVKDALQSLVLNTRTRDRESPQ